MPSNKNLKAAGYTSLVLGLLLLLFFFVSWAPPVHDTPKQMEDIEVELGDAPEGSSGESQGTSGSQPPTPEENISSTTAEKEMATSDVDKEAPALAKKTSIKGSIAPKKPTVESKITATPIETPTAPPPAPKYLYKGVGTNKEGQGTGQGQGTGDGGQGSGQGQGLPAGRQGTGDKGDGIGSGGLSIVRGLQGRKISRFPSFTDEFNENAKVAVDVRVDPNGNVIGANIQPRGTTTANSSIKNIALQKAKLLKFSTNTDAADEEVGTVVFVFRVRD